MTEEDFEQEVFFYPTREWKRRFALIPLIGSLLELPFLFFAGVGLWKFGPFGPILTVLLCIGIYLVFVFIIYFFSSLLTKPIRHIVTSEGITFCSLPYRIYTPWTNIRGIGTSRVGIYHPQALLFEQPAVQGRIQDGVQLSQATIDRRVRWLTTKKDHPDNALPIFFTAPANWQESELGFAIRQYIPHIFEREKNIS